MHNQRSKASAPLFVSTNTSVSACCITKNRALLVKKDNKIDHPLVIEQLNIVATAVKLITFPYAPLAL